MVSATNFSQLQRNIMIYCNLTHPTPNPLLELASPSLNTNIILTEVNWKEYRPTLSNRNMNHVCNVKFF